MYVTSLKVTWYGSLEMNDGLECRGCVVITKCDIDKKVRGIKMYIGEGRDVCHEKEG